MKYDEIISSVLIEQGKHTMNSMSSDLMISPFNRFLTQLGITGTLVIDG
jgi:hypothetical protein